jgi:hypothetical protein
MNRGGRRARLPDGCVAASAASTGGPHPLRSCTSAPSRIGSGARERCAEDGACVDEGVGLAVLAAWVDGGWEAFEQLAVVCAAGEGCVGLRGSMLTPVARKPWSRNPRASSLVSSPRLDRERSLVCSRRRAGLRGRRGRPDDLGVPVPDGIAIAAKKTLEARAGRPGPWKGVFRWPSGRNDSASARGA